jgi:prevent-host-death family protein
MNDEAWDGRTVTIHEAKTHLSRLLAAVEAGEEVVIARGRKEIAKIVPLHPPQKKRRVPGRLAHLVPPGSGDSLSHGFLVSRHCQDQLSRIRIMRSLSAR